MKNKTEKFNPDIFILAAELMAGTIEEYSMIARGGACSAIQKALEISGYQKTWSRNRYNSLFEYLFPPGKCEPGWSLWWFGRTLGHKNFETDISIPLSNQKNRVQALLFCAEVAKDINNKKMLSIKQFIVGECIREPGEIY